jgi:hypothetical protein
MRVIDRKSFMACIDGIILDRQADGTFVCGDIEKEVEEAEEIMERGEKVYLTVDNNIVSYMMLCGEGDDKYYQEFQMEKN